MVDQTTAKPIGLIKDLRMYVHGIPYITTFIILQNIVILLTFEHVKIPIIPCCLVDLGSKMFKSHMIGEIT
jgi:hypothetical protein